MFALVDRWHKSRSLAQLETFLRSVRNAPDVEAGITFLATSMAVDFVARSSSLREFPFEFLHGQRLANTTQEKGELSSCVRNLNRLHKTLVAARDERAGFAAPGFIVLQHSIRAVQMPELLLGPARELWRELMRGLDWIGRTLAHDGDPHLETLISDATQGARFEDFCFVPQMLVPHWQGIGHWSDAIELLRMDHGRNAGGSESGRIARPIKSRPCSTR
jgi:hypothetical protein